MKYELLKRTAIALFVGGIVSASATAEDTPVETSATAEDTPVETSANVLAKAVNAEITKQTEAVKSEVTEKITKQDEKIKEISDDLSGVASDLVGVAANSYNNTLTLNGFKAGDIVYEADPDKNEVTSKKATEEDIKNDPLEGKGIIATVVKNKDSIENLSEGLAETDDKVEELAGDVKKNREDLISANTQFEKLDKEVSELTTAMDSVTGEGGLYDIVKKHKEIIDGDGSPDSGLVHVVDKHSEIINDLKRYNHLDDVKALVENKADKQALEDLKKDVKDNEEEIGKVSDFVNNVDSDVDELVEEHNSLAEKHDKLVEGVKKFTETYNKFADNTNAELDKKADADDVEDALSRKANVSDVYTKAESNSKLDAKANVADVYSKTETDNKFALKADNSVVSAQAVDINNLRTDVNAHKVDINKLRTDVNTHTKRLDHLDNRVNKLDKDLKRGLAAQAALTGLFQPYTVGKANFTAAVGGYKSQTAVAIGTGYRYNQNIATKAGVAFTQGGGVTYNAGVNFEW